GDWETIPDKKLTSEASVEWRTELEPHITGTDRAFSAHILDELKSSSEKREMDSLDIQTRNALKKH
ncbi:unnamed protein product, partial [Medioppia subpectinata]